MDKTLIENWNNRVGKNDFVIFLGDFAYRNDKSVFNYMDRLHGHITFIQGNHDAQLGSNTVQSLILNIEEEGNIYCVHDPKDFSSAYNINLVGHVHQNWKIKKFYQTTLINVGVDVWNFAPVNFDEILEMKETFEKEWSKKWKRKYHKLR